MTTVPAPQSDAQSRDSDDSKINSANDSIVTPGRTVHRCTATMKNGRPCTRDVATLLTPDGWRCPSHTPKPTPDPAARAQRPKPPVTSLRTPRDSVRLSSWAAIQLALGRLDYKEAGGLTAACREFRASWALAERVDAYVQAEEAFFEAVERWAAAVEPDDAERRRQAMADMGAALARLAPARQRTAGRPPKVPPRPPLYGGLVPEPRP